MNSEKKLTSHIEKYYTDEGDVDFKITHIEHQLLMECLTYCLNAFDFTTPLYMHEDYLKEDTITYRKSDSICNMLHRLMFLMNERTDKTPYERVEEYIDEEGHKSYITIPLNDN